ncbi:DUF3192 domain-containing protein [Thalassotalea profundi]|uniref:DUF3192 domain-containing protein n=1 Tax=Thalassotalea profundi TaxID=2036687 RepID=A0ABQ3IKR0_9GAMM|nr:DUF3192 domain-containing protein [Thalassotalea profundi]GHE85211.1 hypothetical protein GCM10011501_12730 [Thalassotalea profundi]
MNKKVVFRIIFALGLYGLFVLLVVKFYDDNPSNMKWEDREEFNRQFINQLQINKFHFDQAIEKLGKPDITEAKSVDGRYYQVLFYRTQHMKSDGFTTQDECSYLLFIDNVLQEYAIASQYDGLDEVILQHQKRTTATD